MPNEIDVKGLRELESKATPGPWTHDRETDYIWGPKGEMVASDIDGMIVRGIGAKLPIDINGELMCAARNALPALLDEIERLREYPSTAAREETDQRASDALAAAFRQRDAAETELSALKARVCLLENAVVNWQQKGEETSYIVNALKEKLERVREWTHGYPRGGGLARLYAILDGKEG